MSYQFYVPTRTLFGAGMLNELHSQIMSGKKAMVVISNGKFMKTTGILERVLKELLAAGVETAVFDKVQANPLCSTVMEGAAFARENSCDFVVALGGGSVMDASKAMAAMVTNSMEHAMSAYHQELPHGAGLIMISVAYYQHFIDCHVCDERFVAMAKALGKADASCAEDFLDVLVRLQKDCGVADLKMSDFGIQESELDVLARNARETMGGLFGANPCELSHEQCVAIYQKSYR